MAYYATDVRVTPGAKEHGKHPSRMAGPAPWGAQRAISGALGWLCWALPKITEISLVQKPSKIAKLRLRSVHWVHYGSLLLSLLHGFGEKFETSNFDDFAALLNVVDFYDDHPELKLAKPFTKPGNLLFLHLPTII